MVFRPLGRMEEALGRGFRRAERALGRLARRWGGSVALLGGALLLGALRRLTDRSRPRVRDSALMALGMALLANSRPFEGFVLSAPATLVLAARVLGRDRPPARVALGRVAAPI